MRLTKAIILCVAIAVTHDGFGATLDFSGDICTVNADGSGGPSPCVSNGAWISNGYGDSALVDITYFSPSPNGNATMQTWITPNTYSDLSGVGYTFFGSDYASITFSPASGNEVTLNSFNLGTAPPNVTRQTTVQIIDLATNSTIFSSLVSVGATAALVSPGVSSAVGLELRYAPDAFNVGIDNIDFTVSAVSSTVPEPSAIVLFAAGLAGLMLQRRKR